MCYGCKISAVSSQLKAKSNLLLLWNPFVLTQKASLFLVTSETLQQRKETLLLKLRGPGRVYRTGWGPEGVADGIDPVPNKLSTAHKRELDLHVTCSWLPHSLGPCFQWSLIGLGYWPVLLSSSSKVLPLQSHACDILCFYDPISLASVIGQKLTFRGEISWLFIEFNAHKLSRVSVVGWQRPNNTPMWSDSHSDVAKSGFTEVCDVTFCIQWIKNTEMSQI